MPLTVDRVLYFAEKKSKIVRTMNVETGNEEMLHYRNSIRYTHTNDSNGTFNKMEKQTAQLEKHQLENII